MKRIKKIFKYEPKIIKTLKEYEQKEKVEQQKPKVQNTSGNKSNN